MICLDTNVIVAAMNQRSAKVRARLEQTFVDGTAVGVPTIALFEPWFGVPKAGAGDLMLTRSSTFSPDRFRS